MSRLTGILVRLALGAAVVGVAFFAHWPLDVIAGAVGGCLIGMQWAVLALGV